MLKEFRPNSAPPKDFLAFWQNTLRELSAVPVRLIRTPVSQKAAQDLILEDISFESLWGQRIHGYFLRPKNGQPSSLVIHAHGYGSNCTVQWDWARAGCSVVGIDVRGYGRSKMALPDPSRWGYVLTGIRSPEKSVLRGAVCDLVRATQVGQGLLSSQHQRTVLYGRSFGGAIALMAEGVAHLADLLALGVPSFGWTEGRHFFVKDGSGQEINAFLKAHPDHTEDTMLVLR